MLILTNIPSFPNSWTARNGIQGRCLAAETLFDLWRLMPTCDVVLIGCDPKLTFQAAALRTIRPWCRRPLVVADLILRKPTDFRQWALLRPKRFLLRRVDHFIHHFQDLTGYERLFGIGPSVSSFVPFKPNIGGRVETTPDPEGEYILCFGWSLRDYDTFFDAIETLPYPAAIVRPDFAGLSAHGSRFSRPLNRLPRQVRLLDQKIDDDRSLVSVLRGAKVVVLPILESCLVGVGTALNAMLLAKCVILTDGPATRRLYTDQVLTTPPGDASQLAAVIRTAWEDRPLRERTAWAGYRYASQLGGEPELFQRIIDRTAEWMEGQATPAGRFLAHSSDS
jgi:glycosyltransferase involved in cell wall biosynthesis